MLVRLIAWIVLTGATVVAQFDTDAAPWRKLMTEGDRLLRTGYPVLAIRQYREALTANAPAPLLQLRIAHAHSANRDYRAATRIVDELLEGKVVSAEALRLRARLDFWQRRYAQSWRWFRVYLARVPADHDVRTEYALSLAWGRRFEDALVELSKLEKTKSHRREARFRRAEVLAWQLRYEPARALATKLLREPKAPITLKARCHVLIGRTFAWEKRFTRAEEEYRRALQENPRSEDGWLALGEVLEWQERTEEARAAYGRALAVAPASARAKAALKRLQER